MARTRITAGEWRGRLIDTPPGSAIRPTRSLIREALFNIMGGKIDGARVLDLYAGAGTLGFEALSRGAAGVTFVERDHAAVRAIEATAARLGCSDLCRIIPADVLRWLHRAADDLQRTDVCFIDAPYRDPELDLALELVAAHPPGLVVCEHHHHRHLPERIGGLGKVREVRHGLTTLSFLQPMTVQQTD